MEHTRLRRILALALPIVGGMTSQNILNLVDTWMVGDLGDSALAAVGLGGFATFMSQAFLTGLSSGVQAMAARRKGEGRLDAMAVPLSGGLLFASAVAIPLSIVLWQLAPSLFALLDNDPEVIGHGVPYYRMRLIGIAAVSCNFAFRGYWNGVDRSRLYMGTLVVMHATNIFLNWVFIYGNLGMQPMGAQGAALATASSNYLGLAIYLALALRLARPAGFFVRLPDRATMVAMLKLALPTCTQQFLFAAGLTALFRIVGMVGTAELAGATVLINLTLVAILPGIGLGLAGSTLVGQALGRKDPDDAHRWGWDVAKVGVVLLAFLGLPMWLAPRQLLGLFLRNPETVALATRPLQLVGLFIAVDGLGLVLMNALLGAGYAAVVMVVTVGSQWLLFLPVAWLVGPRLGGGLTAIWLAQMGWRSLQAVAYVALWQRGDWKKVKLG